MRAHWQTKPLFISGALPQNFLRLRPNDLFKIAGRQEIESRLISRKITGNQWRYRANEGPFDRNHLLAKQTFQNWTLLVQRVNEWIPRVDLFLDHFGFIANWRVDDIMVSYATPGGTVGAHLDNYDVFLCQLHGERTWQFSNRPSKTENLEKDQPVRLLTDFRPDTTVIAKPGDVLYIPPRFAHFGVADSECITISVGFRAPRLERLMGVYLEEMASQMPNAFYTDKGTPVQTNGGQFSEPAMKNLQRYAKSGFTMLSRKTEDESFNDLLLRELSLTANSQILSRPPLSLKKFEARWKLQALQRNPRNQYFYRVHKGSVTLYTAGEQFVLPQKQSHLIAELCNSRLFPCAKRHLRPLALEFWHEMYVMGFVFFTR